MGVLSAYFAGESGLPQREMLYKTARSFGAALALTMIYAGLLRPVMSEVGKLGRVDQSPRSKNPS